MGLNTFELVFEYCDISKEKKVELVSMLLKGRNSFRLVGVSAMEYAKE